MKPWSVQRGVNVDARWTHRTGHSRKSPMPGPATRCSHRHTLQVHEHLDTHALASLSVPKGLKGLKG